MTVAQMKPGLALRVSVTDRCQFRCRYCMPEEGIQSCSHEDILSFEEITSFVRRLQDDYEIKKLRLTGGDPLVRKGIVDLVGMLSRLEIPDLAMTTNAQTLAERAGDLRAAGLSRVNISLDSLEASTFRELTRGGALAKTLQGIDSAIAVGLRPIKLNTVVIGGVNDHEINDLLAFALERGCELRYLELMPVGYGAQLFDKGFVSTESVRSVLESRYSLDALPVASGSSARRFRVSAPGGPEGIVGFISACSAPFCSGCNRLRITADGNLLGCLAREQGFPVRQLLSTPEGPLFRETVERAMREKRSNELFSQPVPMAAIGG